MFEIASWLVFVPRTLRLVLRHPLRMVTYARHEQSDDGDDRYADAMSPPLLLILTIALAHGIEIASGSTVPADTTFGRALMGSDQNLIMTRLLLFALLPLFDMSWPRACLSIGRTSTPFVGQCYLATVYVLATSIVTVSFRTAAPWDPLSPSSYFWRRRRGIFGRKRHSFVEASRSGPRAPLHSRSRSSVALGFWF